jgi:vacuolar protein sorting-associated protein 11
LNLLFQSTMFQWKRFAFFEKEALTCGSSTDGAAVVTSGFSGLALADTDGAITLLDKSLHGSSFQAFEVRCSHLVLCSRTAILAACGDDAQSPGVLKLWNLHKADRSGGFHLALTVRLFPPKVYHKITCVAISGDAQQVAVGCDNGSVILLKGDLLRGRSTQIKVQAPSCVTSIHFCSSVCDAHTIFVTTLTHVGHLVGESSDFVILDENGCSANTAVLTETGELAVARAEAVFLYTDDGRGPCYAFDGDKWLITRARSHLAVVLRDADRTSSPDVIQIYDLTNKLVAFHDSIEGIRHIVGEWGCFFVFCDDGKVFRLTEKDAQSKLETLFRRNLFGIAAQLAANQKFDPNAVADIHRKYGDHLYAKGDFDGAVSQYVRTIGRLEPSYAIRKFLDAQRIHNLTTYLQALHERPGLANQDHTTLLLNCYTRLKDDARLDVFVRSDKVSFDVDNAINVCKQSGYVDSALVIAQRHRRHDVVVKTQVVEREEYDISLDYISDLSFYDAEALLKKHGRLFASKRPERLVFMLISLCTDWSLQRIKNGKAIVGGDFVVGVPLELQKLKDGEAPANAKSSPVEFTSVLECREHLILFIEKVLERRPCDDPALSVALLELYLKERNVSSQSVRETFTSKALQLLENSDCAPDPEHTLLLCQLHDFGEGKLLMFERLKMYGEILQYHCNQGSSDMIVQCCKHFGTRDPSLWISALGYFASQPEIDIELVSATTKVGALNIFILHSNPKQYHITHPLICSARLLRNNIFCRP